MDVTSLLNASSAAHLRQQQQLKLQQQQMNDSLLTPTPSAAVTSITHSAAVFAPLPESILSRRESPHKNRIPWDAGGYSLPLTLDPKIFHHPSVSSKSSSNDSPTDVLASASPNSPKPKISGSQSSLSSYTSSRYSDSHSCISSLSAVSEFQPLANLITDICLDPRMPMEHQQHQQAQKYPHQQKQQQQQEQQEPQQAALRPLKCDSNSVGIPTEQPQSPTSIVRLDHEYSASSSSPGEGEGDIISGVSSSLDSGHPWSPSEVALIKRGQEDQSDNRQELNRLESSSTNSHQRTVSAPDFSFLACPPMGDQMGPSEQVDHSGDLMSNLAVGDHGDAGESVELAPRPDTPEEERLILGEKPTCMFMQNCDTMSTHRKAISHIFGRNKLCTRTIPDTVWVHFCRKHYQRSRYRNAQEYARKQCDLVKRQIRRVEIWSRCNRRVGSTCTVQDWSLSLRKREQKRLDDMKNKKRRHREVDLGDGDAYDPNDRAVTNGTAVPAWLLEKCRGGYTTAEIIAIAEQIEREVYAGRLVQIPDIEILPKILTDKADETKAKGTTKPRSKTTNSNSHRRSQSMGGHRLSTTSRSGPELFARRPSHLTHTIPWLAGNAANEEFGTPQEKRARIEGLFDNYYASPTGMRAQSSNFGMLSPRNTDRIMPNIRGFGTSQLPVRPNFGNIRESQAEDEFYSDGRTTTFGQYGYGNGLMSQSSAPGPLPAPRTIEPAQHSLDTTTATVQTTSLPQLSRSMHGRSYSDASVFQGAQMGYRPTSTSAGYSTGAAAFPALSTYDTISTYSPAPDYLRQESNPYITSSGTGTDGPQGYYDDMAPRQEPHQTYSPASFYHAASTNPTSQMTGSGYGGAAKHTRHQSAPMVPRLQDLGTMRSSLQYDLYPTQAPRHQHQSSYGGVGMPRLDETSDHMGMSGREMYPPPPQRR